MSQFYPTRAGTHCCGSTTALNTRPCPCCARAIVCATCARCSSCLYFIHMHPDMQQFLHDLFPSYKETWGGIAIWKK